MTLSRYYNNNFSDREKQDAMDVFLGVYRCEDGAKNLWDLGTDYYLHNSVPAGKLPCHRTPYSMWCDEEVLLSLPLALQTTHKHREIANVCELPADDERVDVFQDQYRPHDLLRLEELHCHSLSVEGNKDPNPFEVRFRGRQHDETPQNPSLAGDSTSSTLKNEKEDDDERDDEEDTDDDDFENFINQKVIPCEPPVVIPPQKETFVFEEAFRTMKEAYGIELSGPSVQSSLVYSKYANMDSFNDNFSSCFSESDNSS